LRDNYSGYRIKDIFRYERDQEFNAIKICTEKNRGCARAKQKTKQKKKLIEDSGNKRLSKRRPTKGNSSTAVPQHAQNNSPHCRGGWGSRLFIQAIFTYAHSRVTSK
jgi:hypothetical protein